MVSGCGKPPTAGLEQKKHQDSEQISMSDSVPQTQMDNEVLLINLNILAPICLHCFIFLFFWALLPQL